MPNRPNRDTNESTDSIPPDHHHGGQELPDDVQDRPEQNAGYDAAVRGESGDNDDERAAAHGYSLPTGVGGLCDVDERSDRVMAQAHDRLGQVTIDIHGGWSDNVRSPRRAV